MELELTFLTQTYPYGPGEEFVHQELVALCGFFSRVHVVPTAPVRMPSAQGLVQPLPSGCVLRDDVVAHLVRLRQRPRLLRLAALLADREGRHLLRCGLVDRSLWRAMPEPISLPQAIVPASPTAGAGELPPLQMDRQRPLLTLTKRLARVARTPQRLARLLAYVAHQLRVRTALRAATPALPRQLHAFWLHSGALGAVLAQHRPLSARAHGGDLYAYRHDGYLPLHDFTQARLDALLLISDHGAAYLQARSAAAAAAQGHRRRPTPVKIRPQVVRLGTPAARTLAQPGDDGCLHVLSVGRAVPLKRLPLLARAVGLCDFPVIWTHLGSGPELSQCQLLARSYKPAQQARFFGYLPQASLRAYYETEAVDLCVSVSACEGLPVSLMEALAHGVPTLATAAGGSPEALLDAELCLPLQLEAPAVAAALQHFARRPKEARQFLRKRAVALWAERFAAAAQGPELIEALADLSCTQKA